MNLRVKLALLSLLCSGVLLVGFSLYFLKVVSTVQMERIDREIATLGNAPLRRLLPRQFWEDFGKSLQIIYGDERALQLVACVWDADRHILYKSPQCPPEILNLPVPESEFGMPPPVAQEPEKSPAPRSDWSKGPEMQPPPPPPAEPAWPGGPRIPLSPPLARMKKPIFQTVTASNGDWRVGILGNEQITMAMGLSLANYHRDAERVRRALLVCIPLGLFALGAGGWLLATRALRPVALITAAAQQITACGLDQRVPTTASDPDLARLVEVINGMLDRLEKSFHQAVRFSADAAHELQTPLTVLQGELEQAIQKAPLDSDEQQHYNDLLEEVQRLKTIVQKLLLLARADAGELTLNWEPVDLTTLVKEAVEDVKVIAPDLQVQQELPAGVRVLADPDLLAQVIHNLTSNAVKYNSDSGRVKFELKTAGRNAQFTLSNTGMPIPEADRDRIFDRFYRVDKSRSRRVGGAGLGLSLALEIARAHRGDLVLNPADGNWISFTLTLPLAG
jgi:signal transduction histidine kinase